MTFVHSLAWRHHRRSGIEFEELLQEGFAIVVRCRSKYDKKRGAAFQTFAWKCVDNGLKNFVKKNDRPPEFDPDLLFNRHPEWDPLQALIWKETLELLSDEGKVLLQLIMSNYDELLGQAPKKVRGVLFRKVKLELHWTERRIWACFRELKTAAGC